MESQESQCECEKRHLCGKYYIWNLAIRSCENGKYLVSIIENSVITSDEIIEEETKQLQEILMKKMQSIKQKVSLFYLPFFINNSCIINSW